VGGVAQEGDARDSVPPVANRQGIDCAKDGSVSPSVMSAVSSGAHPVNFSATRAVAAAGPAESMSAIHSCGLDSATYV
jgi:hypothetical protein